MLGGRNAATAVEDEGDQKNVVGLLEHACRRELCL